MRFLDLFVVALMPVLKTLLITAVGLFLALDRLNILTPVARHHLNNLVFFVFCPSLVVSNLASTITASSIVSLWFMPVNILLTFILGSALGWILTKITRTPQHLHGVVIGCCAAGNLGNLLLIIIPAVCTEKNSPFGDSSTCSANGEAYASLSLAIGAVYIWSYVYNIMRVYGTKGDKGNDINSTINTNYSSGERITEIFSESFTESLVSRDYPIIDYEAEAEAEVPLNGSQDKMKVPIFKKIKLQVKSFARTVNLKSLLAPATIATIVGLIIGVVSPLRKLMIGHGAPLRAIEGSVVMLGAVSIPAMTLIVGANLLGGLKKSGLSLWVVIGTLVVRYIALPLLGIVVIKAARHFGMVGSDSLYQFILLLQYALPPAMAVGTITQMFEVGESECSVIMLWNYVVASLSVTLWVTCYMWLVS